VYVSKTGFITLTALASLSLVVGEQAASAQPTGPAPAPTTATTTTPTPDSASPPDATKKPEPKPLFWRGTTVDWESFATTTAMGIGSSEIGNENNEVGMLFTAAPNVYVLDLPKDKINISASLALIVELSNTSQTDTLHEPLLRDLPINATYTRTIFQSADKEWETKGKVSLGAIFPTSPLSYHEGKYLTTSVGVGVSQKFKLLGKDADGLNDLTVALKLTWNHLFSRSYTPTDLSLDQLRQDATGQTIQSDQLSYNSFDVDQLIPAATIDLPLYKDLSLNLAGRLIGRFKHNFSTNGCDTTTLTGCVQAQTLPNQVSYTTLTLFDASLTQSILGLVDVSVGYYNLASGIGEDGLFRNPLYSPDAEFYADITANIDVIYAKASGREEMDLPGRKAKTAMANPTTGMPSF
jgi:hypothetical protein